MIEVNQPQPLTDAQRAALIVRVLYPMPEAAALLGISLRGLNNLIANKEIRTVKVGKRRRLVPRAEIEKIARAAR